MTSPNTGPSFDSLGIAPKLLEILHRLKFVTPTPIQLQSIPPAIEGKDIMGIAQTGTGKTLAFGIPMIQRLAQARGKNTGLVVLPTRELALQVNETLKKVGSPLGMKTAILIGGESMGKQIRLLQMKPHVIIGTPGRLIDHMENKRLNFSDTSILVLDEADRMLDMGFAPQIKKILQNVPKDRQTMLFSATMPDAIVNIAKSYMSMPLRVEVAPAGTTVKSVTQELFFVQKHDKPEMLKTLLAEYKGSVLVFSRTKFAAKKIAQQVRTAGHTATEIHSNRSLNQRLEALEGFKIGRYRVLIATDIAARGIDVTGIQLVINYDLPDNAEDYVHRIGRTGRAGLTGHAISLATPDQRNDVRSIERLIRTTLPVSKSPVSTAAPARSERSFDRPERPRGEHRPRTGHRPERTRTEYPRKFTPASKTYGAAKPFKRESFKSSFKSGGHKRSSKFSSRPASRGASSSAEESRGYFLQRRAK